MGFSFSMEDKIKPKKEQTMANNQYQKLRGHRVNSDSRADWWTYDS